MDCSLLSTPEFQSDNAPESVHGSTAEVLDKDTRRLISDFLNVYTGVYIVTWHQSKPLLTMKSVVDYLLDKHSFYYNGMRDVLQLDDRGDDVSFVQTTARSMFSDGNTSWNRIGSVLAFGATVCQCYVAEGREDCVERVAQEIATYLLSDHREWLVRHNGWNGFVDFFRVSWLKRSVCLLGAFILLAGIVAAVVMAFYIILIIRVPNPGERNVLMAFVGLVGLFAVLAVVHYIRVYMVNERNVHFST